MSRLSIFLLASALAPAAAAAQTVSPPVPWEDTPQVRLNVPAGSAVAPPRAAVAARPATTPPAARPAPVAASAPPAIRPAPVATPVRIAAAPAASPARPVVMAAVPQHRRLQRGHSVGAFWRSPRVEVRNHGRYGLYPPAGDDRWVRYYDDALLVDRSGVVRDGRYGLDWDQQGGWAEEGSIPVYVGDGDFRPGRDDYAYVEGYDDYADAEDIDDYAYDARDEDYRGHAYRDRRVVDGRPGYSCQVVHGNGPPMPCEAGYRPAWVYDYPPGTVITETIVTTSSRGPVKAKAHAEPRRKVVRKRAVVAPYGERG